MKKTTQNTYILQQLEDYMQSEKLNILYFAMESININFSSLFTAGNLTTLWNMNDMYNNIIKNSFIVFYED